MPREFPDGGGQSFTSATGKREAETVLTVTVI